MTTSESNGPTRKPRISLETQRWLIMGLTVALAMALGINLSRIVGGVGPPMMAVAVIGAVLNISSREREIEDFRRMRTLWDIVAYFFWKCVVAVAFASVLYLMFMAGLVAGDAFPRFNETADRDFVDMWTLFEDVKPATNIDVAKLMFWSFVAGYSELFVPNLVAQMTTREVETKDTAAAQLLEHGEPEAGLSASVPTDGTTAAAGSAEAVKASGAHNDHV